MKMQVSTLYLLILSATVAVTFGEEHLENAVNSNESLSIQQRGDENDVKSVLQCVLNADWDCVPVKLVRTLRLWLNLGTIEEVSHVQSADNAIENKQDDIEDENDEGGSQEYDEYKDTPSDEYAGNSSSTGGGKPSRPTLLETIVDTLIDGISSVFSDNFVEDRRDPVLHGSRSLDRSLQQVPATGRKRKARKHGRDGVTELVSVITMLNSGLMSLGTGFSSLLQLKIFVFTVLGFILSAVRLYLQYKAAYLPPVNKIFHARPEFHEHTTHIPYGTPIDYAHNRAYFAQKLEDDEKYKKQGKSNRYLELSQP